MSFFGGMLFFSSGASRGGVQATSKQGQKQTIIFQTSILRSTEDMSQEAAILGPQFQIETAET